MYWLHIDHELIMDGCTCQVLPNKVRVQVRTAAMAAVLRPASRSGDTRWLQERRFPVTSQVQTEMDSVLVLLRDGLPPSEITTGRK